MATGGTQNYKRIGLAGGVPLEVLDEAIRQITYMGRADLPSIFSLRHFSHQTELSYTYLRSVIGRRRDPYKVFQISKRRGGKRNICVPETTLLVAQKWLHKYILSKQTPHWRSFAFHKDSSIVKCASVHCDASWIVKLDIQRFFESTNETKIFHVFKGLGYSSLVAFELARLCTRTYKSKRPELLKTQEYEPARYSIINSYRSELLGSLPQGAPTSPMLSNLACLSMDEELQLLAENYGCVYTRYADDITFSYHGSGFDRSEANKVIGKSYDILRRNNYIPNTFKTSVVPPGAKKIVLGLNVGGLEPRVSKEFRSKIEHHLWAINRFGLAGHSHSFGFKSMWGFKNHLMGKIAFVLQVDPRLGADYRLRFVEAFEHCGYSFSL